MDLVSIYDSIDGEGGILVKLQQAIDKKDSGGSSSPMLIGKHW